MRVCIAALKAKHEQQAGITDPTATALQQVRVRECCLCVCVCLFSKKVNNNKATALQQVRACACILLVCGGCVACQRGLATPKPSSPNLVLKRRMNTKQTDRSTAMCYTMIEFLNHIAARMNTKQTDRSTALCYTIIDFFYHIATHSVHVVLSCLP